MIRKDVLVAILATFCLIAALFLITPLPTRSQSSSKPYNPFFDLNDDGTIDIYDAITLSNYFGTSGTPINKTALLDLQSQIDALNATLQSQINALNATITELQNNNTELENRVSMLEGICGLPIVNISGLVGYWRFNEGSGNITHDSSGNNNDGTLNGPTWADGKYGTALNFDGVDDWVGIPTLFSSNPSALTISAWINSPLFNTGYVFYHGDTAELTLGNGNLYPNGTSEDPDSALFGLKLSDGSSIVILSNPMTPNVWHNIVGVWIKGVALRVYVDGVLAGENTAIPNLYPYAPGYGFLPTIGTYNRGYTGPPDRFFNGTIDDLMVYNRALKDTEVLNLYLNPPP